MVVGYATQLGRPTGLVAGLGRLYVADSAGHRLIALSQGDCRIVSTRSMPAAPHALALDARTRRLYVGLMGVGRILALNADTLEPLGETQLAGLGYPQDMALDSAAERLFVAHALSPKYGALSVVDTRTMSVIDGVTGNPRQPLFGIESVCLDSARGVVHLGLYGGVSTLDAQSLRLRQMRAVGDGPVYSIATAPVGSALFIRSRWSGLWRWQDDRQEAGHRDERR